MRKLLIEGFAYDEWATLKWVETLPVWPNPLAPTSVIEHILSSQERWLARCDWNEPCPRGDLVECARLLSAMWRRLLSDTHPATIMRYRDARGEPFARSVGEIARHVVNHGTFHRGQIRALAEAQGLREWPDTDLIYYCDAMRRAKR